MIIPRKLTVFGEDWRVTKDPKRNDAYWEYDGREGLRHIMIGTAHPDRTFENLIHELGEVIITRGLNSCFTSSHKEEEGRMLFILDHHHYGMAMRELANVLKQITF